MGAIWDSLIHETTDIRATILSDLAQTLHDPACIAEHRVNPKDFTRKRVLSPAILVAFLVSTWKGGLQTLLDRFLESLTGKIGREITNSALSQARKKLNASVFEALSQRLLGSPAAHLPGPRWRGLRLVATDSTTLRPPNSLENQEAFAVQWDKHGQSDVLVRILRLFSTTSKLMLKSVIGRYRDRERALLVQLLRHLAQADLLVMDRGFPAIWLCAYLDQVGLGFLARMDNANGPEVRSFLRSRRQDAVVERSLPPHARRQARKLGLALTGQTLSFCLIRAVLPTGRIEVPAHLAARSHRLPLRRV